MLINLFLLLFVLTINEYKRLIYNNTEKNDANYIFTQYKITSFKCLVKTLKYISLYNAMTLTASYSYIREKHP